MLKATKLKCSEDFVPIDVHFRLYAGPGAGKTTFLTKHIKRILEHSTKLNKSKKIACITYTNIGVETLKNRLKDASSDVEISTIHSFLYKHVIKPYLWTLKDCPFRIELLNGHDEVNLTRSLLKEFKDRSSSYFKEKNNKELSDALKKLIWHLENESLELKFLKAYQGKIESHSIKKNSYMIYKEICWENGFLSHDDVLFFSYKLLKQNDEINRILRAKFPYMLLDEFQDTSPLQAEIIKIIAQKETIVGVIGDPCQSIFSFQGTDEMLFENFELKNIKNYYLENNHRSTTQIISLLNHIRSERDFKQSSPSEKQGDAPVILIGNSVAAYKYVSEIKQEFCTLSYKNEDTKSLKFDIESADEGKVDLRYGDGHRGWMIQFIVQSIEYAHQMKIKEAIKFMQLAYHKVNPLTEEEAFINLKRLLDCYEVFSKNNIKDFYNNYIYNYSGVKTKVSSGGISEFYEQTFYKSIALNVKIVDDTSLFRTIHKSKGDEFDNVLVILNDTNEKNNLKFLLSPDLTNEVHRVYYVASSRAKENLFINSPKISNSEMKKLEKLGIICVTLSDK
nr:ATP-dependent helicase [Exiguobacterium sp. s193]